MLRLAVDLKAMAERACRPEVPRRRRLRDLDFKNFPSNVCQCHKSRSKSSEVIVGEKPPSRLPSCKMWSLSVTNRRCSRIVNMATSCEVPEIRDESAPKSYETNLWKPKHPWTFGYTVQYEIRRRPRGQGCSGRRERRKCTSKKP